MNESSPSETSPPAPTGPGKGSLLVIFLTVFIDLLGFGMVLPLLPIYAKHFITKEQIWLIGPLMASFSAMQFIWAPIWGRISDRIGRRPVLMIGLAGSVAFYTLFGLATIWRSIFWLFVARIGAGIAGANIPITQAYIADTTTLENRTKGMTLIGAAFGLGFTLGPLLGGLAISAETIIAPGDGESAIVAPAETATPKTAIAGARSASGQLALVARGEAAVPEVSAGDLSPAPGYFAAGLSAIALALAFFKLPESLKPGSISAARRMLDRGALGDALRTPSIVPLLTTLFVLVLAFGNFESTLSLMLSAGAKNKGPFQFSTVQVQCAFAFVGLTLCIAQGVLVRRLSSTIPEATMATFGAALEVGGFGLMLAAVWTGSVPVLFIAMLTVVCGFAFVMPSVSSLLSRRSDPAKQGGILGLSQSVSALARIFGPLLGISLFQVNVMLPYVAAASIMALGLLMIVLFARSGHDYGVVATEIGGFEV